MWSSHPEFPFVVKKSWVESDLVKAIANFEKNVSLWNKDTSGNIFYKKKRILQNLIVSIIPVTTQ